jgi:hypothetical protein
MGGHCFVKIVERDQQPLKLVNLDPKIVRPIWSEDDFTEVSAYILEWAVERRRLDSRGRDIESVIVAKRQRIERDESRAFWAITDEESVGDLGTWMVTAEARWMRPWAPIVDWQNLPNPNAFWGLSDLEPPIVDMIQTANFLLSNSSRITRFHAHPKVWVKGAKADDLETAPDEALLLPKDAEIGQLVPEADLSQILALYDKVMDVLHQASRVPRVALGNVDALGPTPGVTLQIMYRPLLALTEDKRRLYGDGLIELNRRIASLGGLGEEVFTTIPWPDPLPKDDLTEAQTATAKQAAGVSKDTTLSELGYDPDDERDKRKIDAEEAGLAMMAAAGTNAEGE